MTLKMRLQRKEVKINQYTTRDEEMEI